MIQRSEVEALEARVEALEDRLIDCETDKSVLKHIIIKKRDAPDAEPSDE
ncbi:MAG: hypothetical protein M3R16_00845 [Pseudomonadota bacterium]|nr:hypothetical protein [Pseudomonadota bacterium]